MPGLPRIVGICGGIGAGKDTVANALIEVLEYRRISFAWKLKQVCADVFCGVPNAAFFGSQADKRERLDAYGLPGMTGRKILETIGAACRAVDPDVWLRYAMRLVDGHDEAGRWVISDVRYQNEIDAIHERGGVVWRVQKAGIISEYTGHESDRGWRDFAVDAELEAEPGDVAGLQERALSLAEAGGR